MAKKKETAIAVATSAELETIDFGEHEELAEEAQVGADHYLVPWVKLLQTNSPECTPDGGNIGSAGQFLITSDETLIEGDTGFTGNIAMVDHNWTEWVPREQGGGFMGVHDSGSPVVKGAGEHPDKKGMRRTADGNDLSETFYMYLALDDGTMAIVPFKSSAIRPYKAYMGKIGKHLRVDKNGRKKPYPLPSRRVKITCIYENNAKGSFYNHVVSPETGDAKTSISLPSTEGFQNAVAFRNLLKDGKAKVDHSTGGNEGAPSAEDEEIPF